MGIDNHLRCYYNPKKAMDWQEQYSRGLSLISFSIEIKILFHLFQLCIYVKKIHIFPRRLITIWKS